MKTVVAVTLGKLIAKLSQKLHLGGGTAAPGLVALKIDPDLVKNLTKSIPKNIIITGTNGKTTTTRMLTHFAKSAGLKVTRNHTGSNLERGIASALIQNCRLHPRGVNLTFDLGIWELDEAAFNIVAPKIKPDMVVFLNVFRDQLDRYGEVNSVVKNWNETLKELDSKTVIYLNGDDAILSQLNFKGKKYTFGVKDFKIIGESIIHQKDSEQLDFEAKDVKLNRLNSSSFLLHTTNYQLPTTLPLPGIYHIYDFLAAFALGHELGLTIKNMVKFLKTFQPAFGRVEKLPFGYIFLIKNPAGSTQILQTITPQLTVNDRLLLALNDNLADGTDVSWIWDANFEVLRNSSRAKSRNLKIYVSGTRAEDLAVRLKYAGFNPKTIMVQPDLKKALKQARKDLKGRLFILPTYTAMLKLQSILAKMGIKKHYWKED